jgi:hypothetical protein
MKVTQIAPYVNAALKETLGEEAVTTDDLSNIVDQGTAIENASLMDTFTKGLMNQIGRMVFVERKYDGIAPSVLMDGSEYGSVVAKFSTDMPEAQEDQSWSLKNGATYAPVFYSTEAEAKLFNSTNPYEFRRSVYYDQLKQSFRSPEEMNRFLSMVATQVQNAATVSVDNTIRATINNAIGETLHAEMSDGTYTGKTGVRAINLLHLYNTKYGTKLTPDQAIVNPEFIRYAILVIGLVKDRMHGMNTLYNIGGKTRFTPDDRMHTILLSVFAKAAGVFLYDGNGQYRVDNLSLGTVDTIPYWQGIGNGFGEDLGFEEASKVSIKTSGNNTVTASGIVGVVFDREALGVYNKKEKVTTDYSGAGDFWTSYYKYRAMHFNDFNEQFVVFYIA